MSPQPTTQLPNTEPPGESFPAASRLLRRSEFKAVQERGLRNADTALVFFVLGNSLGRRRLGITVSKKVGNAVCRARIRRLLRDVFRKERRRLPPSVDLVVIARRAAAQADRERLLKEFLRASAWFCRRLCRHEPAAAEDVNSGVRGGAGA